MSSANFFSLLEDNSSSEPIEIAKKKAQQQQTKPQPKEVAKDAKEAPKQQKGKDAPQQTQGAEKTQQRPQTSQENRGRGGRPQQRPQTSQSGERPARREQSGDQQSTGRGRGGRGRPTEGDDSRPRREFKPRTERPAQQSTGSPVDTTTTGGDQYIEKRSKPAGGKSHQYDANAPRRGRQFDRSVSGTGRGRGLKKGGEGAHNWGKEGEFDVRKGERTFQKRGKSEGKVVVKGEDAPVEGVTTPIQADETKAETPVDGEAKTEEETKADEPTAEEKKEAEEVTYEEYLKQQKEKRSAFALKPNEVAVPTPAPTAEKKKKEPKVAKVGEVQSIQEFLADRAEALNQQRENERERGNRGGNRGNNRRQGGQRTKAQAPDVKDTKAFPSLGK